MLEPCLEMQVTHCSLTGASMAHKQGPVHKGNGKFPVEREVGSGADR